MLSVRGLWLANPRPTALRPRLVDGVDLDVAAGEVVGLAGLMGAGRTELLETLFGARAEPSGGEVRVDGRPVTISSPLAAKRAGLALVTEDRKRDGLVLGTAIEGNLALTVMPSLARFGLVRRGMATALALRTIKTLAIRASGPKQTAGTLSGGNQQKVVIGKWLATTPRVLLLDEPTRGIDVGAKAEIYRLVRELSAQGIAILVASSEMPELLALSDRILVLREGRPTALLRHAEFIADTILDFASPGGQVQEPYRRAVGRPARRPRGRRGRDAAQGELSMASVAETDARAGAATGWRGGPLGAALRFVLSTKLYWGLALLLLVGVLSSPVNSRGVNIFLSPGNLSNVLRQVSNNGMVAVGMTLVILTGGIDLSVGSILALGSVLCAMLLTMEGWTSAAVISIPVFGVVLLFLVAWTVPAHRCGALDAGDAAAKLAHRSVWSAGRSSPPWRVWWAAAMVPGKFGVAGVLAVVPAVGLVLGALNGFIIAKGRLQPFIVTLAMMVGILGMARLVTGQDQSVVPVYAGTNATEDIELLRALLWGVLPIPGLFFLAACAIFAVLLGTTTFGRYVYAIGGNEQATRLSGVAVDRVKIAVYGLSGMLASLAGVLYTAQYLQGKPDAGEGSSSTRSPPW